MTNLAEAWLRAATKVQSYERLTIAETAALVLHGTCGGDLAKAIAYCAEVVKQTSTRQHQAPTWPQVQTILEKQ